MPFLPKPSGKGVAMTFVSGGGEGRIQPIFQFGEYCILHVAMEVIDAPPSHIDSARRTLKKRTRERRSQSQRMLTTYIMEALK